MNSNARRHSNVGSAQSTRIAHSSGVLEMAVFDALPRRIREAIHAAPIPWLPSDIAACLRQEGYSRTLEIIRYGGTEICRREWLDTFGREYPL